MKKERWYDMIKEEEKSKEDVRISKALIRMVKKLYRYCERNGLNHCDLYVIKTEEAASLNYRAKSNDKVIANGYGFIRDKDEEENN